MGGDKIGRTTSDVKYHRDDDTYDLHTYFQQFRPQDGPWPFPIKSMDGFYRVTREGELRTIEETITLDVVGQEAKVKVTGEVKAGILTPQWEIFFSPLGKKDFTSPPIEVSKHGSVLNPLQLVNALKGVHQGQKWRMPVFDPLGESMTGLLPGQKPHVRYVDAEVQPAPEPIVWHERRSNAW